MIFDKEQLDKANFILNNPVARLSELFSSELKDLSVAWCYYSGKIEGSTYTYIETESLLKDNITSTKRYEDAKMLKNLYNAFVSELEYINKSKNKETIDEKTLLRLHSIIAKDLVSDENLGKFRTREVRIQMTTHIPPKDIYEIKYEINNILLEQDNFRNPLEKAVFLHCNIAKTQPFIDANKRTSRLIESIALMNNDIIPVYSEKDTDIINYRKSLIHFYEKNDYTKYADFFLNRQIERINQIAPSRFQYDQRNGLSRH